MSTTMRSGNGMLSDAVAEQVRCREQPVASDRWTCSG